VRGWTTSPNPALRFVLIGLSFVLLNVWVYLRALFTQVPRRGGRWLDTKRFQLNRLASSSFVPSSNTTDALMTLLR
jgi:IS4 transposase